MRNASTGENASAAIIGGTLCASAIPGSINAETVNRAFRELIFIRAFYRVR